MQEEYTENKMKRGIWRRTNTEGTHKWKMLGTDEK